MFTQCTKSFRERGSCVLSIVEETRAVRTIASQIASPARGSTATDTRIDEKCSVNIANPQDAFSASPAAMPFTRCFPFLLS